MKHVHSFLIPNLKELEEAAAKLCLTVDPTPVQELLMHLSRTDGSYVVSHTEGRVYVALIHPNIDLPQMTAKIKDTLDPVEAELVLSTYEYGTIAPVEMGVPA